MMPSRKVRILASIALASTVLAACGGGGGGSFMPVPTPRPSGSAAPSPSASATPGATATASFSITIPVSVASTASTARRPLYVSPSTQSLTIALTDVNGTASTSSPVVVQVGSGQSGCTSTAPVKCTATMTVPAGSYDTFTISTYSSTNGTGTTPLSTTTVTQQFAANQTTSVPFTLGGVVASIAMSPSVIHTVQGGGTSSYLVSVTALDASGNVILGGTLQSPISISVNNDPQHALLVSQTTILSPGTPVQVRYNGTKTLADGQIVASAASLGSAKTDVIPLSFSPATISAQMGAGAQQVTVSEFGFTGQFTASIDDTAVATAAVTPAGSGTATINVTPAALGGSSGPATMTISDGTLSTTIPITVSPPTINGITYYPQNSATFAPVAITYDSVDGYVYTANLMRTIDEFNPVTKTMLGSYAVPSTYGFGSMHSITSDSSGNVWFVYDSYPARICEMAIPSHTITCYSGGIQSGANLFDIAAAADGSIWFTDSPYTYLGGVPAIGRFNPTAGQSVEYTTGLLSGAQPYGIVYDPANGNMYFSDSNTNVPAFGSVSTASATLGTINEYTAGLATPNPVTQQESAPYDITLGPDGNIWAGDPDQPSIDEFVVSQNQTVQHFNGIQRYGSPWGITAVPGNTTDLWFIDAGLFAPVLVGDVKIGGITQEYAGFPSTATASAQGIVATSSTDLWFYDQQATAMGHVTIP